MDKDILKRERLRKAWDPASVPKRSVSFEISQIKVLLQLLRTLNKTFIHNRLMQVHDRELALCGLGMPEADVPSFLGFMTPTKVQRVKEEMARNRKRRFNRNAIVRAVNVVTAAMTEEKAGTTEHGYLRPIRKEDKK